MKLDVKQIAAGTALAGMTQAELASAAGLDPASLSRILSGDAQPRPETLERIKFVLEARHVEFGPRSGVSLKDDYVIRIEGVDGYLKLYDMILRTMIGRDEDVLFFMVDPSVSAQPVKDAKTKLYDAGIRCRHLCPTKVKIFDAPVADYKIVPDPYFINTPQVIFDRFVATTAENPLENVIVLNSQQIASAERAKFNFIWDHCDFVSGYEQ